MNESEKTLEVRARIGTSPPKRLNGAGKTFLRGRRWTIRYYHGGRQYQESACPNTEAQARRLLRKRLGEIGIGVFIGPDETRLAFEELVTGLEHDYELNGRRSAATMQFHVRHLRSFFGLCRAVNIVPDRVKAYQVYRLRQRAAPATINREVAT